MKSKLKGCGASCIYALIICSMNKEWKMLVSDIDVENIESARENVAKNNLESRISGKELFFLIFNKSDSFYI